MNLLHKKILSLLLALILLMGALPLGVWAEEIELSSEGFSEVMEMEEVPEEETVEAPTAETAESGEHQFSYHYENPMYTDLEVTETAAVYDGPIPTSPIYSSREEAVGFMREQMKARQVPFTVRFTTTEITPSTPVLDSVDIIGAWLNDMRHQAEAHTGVPTEGDYLAWQTKCWDAEFTWDEWQTPTVVTITYTGMVYMTTSAQEQAVTSQLNTIMSSLNLNGKSDYEKVCAIYNYITANIAYDYTNLNNKDDLLKATAYGALSRKKAVCQGYSVLFYRMCLMAGIDCRAIPSVEKENHMWNIVKLDGKYYNVDATWDAGRTTNTAAFFLRCNANFPGHTRNAGYTTASFNTRYPMATKDYAPCTSHTPVANTDKPATCSATGLTGGTHCSKCGKELTPATVVPTKAHTIVSIPTVPATCSATGLTGGKKCSVCGTITTAPKTTPKTSHTSVAIPAKAPTCTTTGLTAGTKCRVCGVILTPQSTVAAKSHSFYGGKCSTCGTLDNNLTGMYRLYNPYTLEHMFNSSAEERAILLNLGWTLDGFAFSAPSSGQPVYRLYNPYGDWHTYSTNQNEINNLKASGWQVDGVMGFSATSEFSPVYKMFNPYERINYWHFCSDTTERDWLVSLGWQYQGIAWYAIR